MVKYYRRITLELDIDGKLYHSESISPASLPARRIHLNALGKMKCKGDWQIFVKVPSKYTRWKQFLTTEKLNVDIEKIKPDDIMLHSGRNKRTFDIFELKRLRDKGLSWIKIALQLYSNERTLRIYFKEHQNELNDDTENNL